VNNKQFKTDLLVGCDGANSRVRSLCFNENEFSKKSTRHAYVTGVAPYTTPQAIFVEFWGRTVAAFSYPISKDQRAFTMVLKHDAEALPKYAEFEAAMQQFDPSGRLMLKSVVSFAFISHAHARVHSQSHVVHRLALTCSI
jgi:2-polyprenyl-6-methoxyphenol hydroxylase-like FAD-dependent oxidoreductase